VGGFVRPWLVVTLVIVGVAAAGVAGYAIGEESRKDDVESAEARAAKSSDEAAKAEKQLAEEQSQDKEALEALSAGLQQLGGAIEQQDAQDDQAARSAVDQAADDIRAGLDQLGTEARADAEKAVGDLSQRINEAVGSSTANDAPEGSP
jgi:hypothetical protein